QSDAGGPQDFLVRLQKVAVAIDGLRAEKDLQVSQKVADHEQKQRATADRHDVFPAERSIKKIRGNVHANPAGPAAAARVAGPTGQSNKPLGETSTHLKQV